MFDADRALAKLLDDQPGAVALLQHLAGGLPGPKGILEDELTHLILGQFASDVHAAIKRKLEATRTHNLKE